MVIARVVPAQEKLVVTRTCAGTRVAIEGLGAATAKAYRRIMGIPSGGMMSFIEQCEIGQLDRLACSHKVGAPPGRDSGILLAMPLR